MRKIVTIGGATQDIFINYEDAETLHLHTKFDIRSYVMLQEGIKIGVKSLFYTTGGGATNSGFGFKKLGLNVTICAAIGHDEAGQFILNELQKIGLSTDYISVKNNAQTAISFIIPSLEHNYTALCFRGINTQLELSNIPLEQLNPEDFVYITSLSDKNSDLLPRVIEKIKTKSTAITIALNPGASQLIEPTEEFYNSLKSVDLLVVNAHEAKQLFKYMLDKQKTDIMPINPDNNQSSSNGPRLLQKFFLYNSIKFTLYNFFTQLAQTGPRIILVTDGSRGVYIYYNNIIYFHPSIAAKIASTLGAGDAFSAGFIGALALNCPIEQAIRFGIINSTSVISQMGAKTGLLNFEELRQKAQELSSELLEKYSLNNYTQK